MAELSIQKYSANEIAKASDFNNAEAREIENLHTLFGEEFDVDKGGSAPKHVIIRGLEVEQYGGGTMNVQVRTGEGYYNASPKKLLHLDSTFGPISVPANGSGNPRIDIIEAQYTTVDYDTQQRAFKDPATGDISYSNMTVKQRSSITFQLKQGTPAASPVAPSTTSGWMKIAQVYVANGASSILDANINNVSAGYSGEANTGWSTETDTIFRLKSRLVMKGLFRAKHGELGDHDNDVIRDQHLDWGTGAGQVDSDVMPLGTAITEPSGSGGTAFSLVAGDYVRVAIQKLVDLLGTMTGVHDGKVLTRHIGSTQVTQAKMANDSVGTAQLVNLNVTDAKLATDSVTNTKILADAVNDPKIDWGTGANQVDADLMPRGTAKTPPWGGSSQQASSLIRVCLDDIIDHCSVYM